MKLAKMILALFLVAGMSLCVLAMAENTLKLPADINVIGQRAFYGNTSIDEVVLPEGILEIHSEAFAYSSLSTISLPDSLDFIANDAFTGVQNLVVNANAGTHAYAWAIQNGYIASSPVSDFVFYPNPDGTCELRDYVGNDEHLIIPPKDQYGRPVVAIGHEAFYWKSELISVTIPLGVTVIDEEAFYCCKKLENVYIPNSVTSIGYTAFTSCESLTHILLPESLKSISDYAFMCCNSLTNITIPAGVESIGRGAFAQCTELVCIETDEHNPYFTSIDGVVYNKAVTEPVVCPSAKTSVVLPESVTRIPERIFDYCVKLKSIELPQGLKSIGDDAFNNCTGLTLLSIPDGVTTIGNGTFFRCTGFTSIIIPDSVTSIGDLAFYSCSNLQNVTLPNNEVTLGKQAFSYCINLRNVTVQNGITSLGESAFSECRSLKAITLPSSVTSIGKDAFYHCASYFKVTVVRGSYAEQYCKDNHISIVYAS